MSLDGKNALVTGGGSGIGRAIALRLARDGAAVAILDLNLEGARQTAEDVAALGRGSFAVRADVASAADVEAAAREARQRLGPITILINNAGIGHVVAFVDTTEEDWDRMIDVHMKGAFLCAREVVPDMLQAGWGRVVSISSVAGLQGAAGFVHYSAAKAGIIGFTKGLAQELGRHGITVNAIAPGLIDTPILGKADLTRDVQQRMVRRSAVGRIGQPEDMAAACAYLVSEEASFCTGQVISPNGGMYF
jgi:2-hydroxycyclohexanecarboxyl-CoA dehydrogenase